MKVWRQDMTEESYRLIEFKVQYSVDSNMTESKINSMIAYDMCESCLEFNSLLDYWVLKQCGNPINSATCSIRRALHVQGHPSAMTISLHG